VYHIAVAFATTIANIYFVHVGNTNIGGEYPNANLFQELFFHSLWITFGPGPRCVFVNLAAEFLSLPQKMVFLE